MEPVDLFADAGIGITQLWNSQSRVFARRIEKAREWDAERAGDPAFGLNTAPVALKAP